MTDTQPDVTPASSPDTVTTPEATPEPVVTTPPTTPDPKLVDQMVPYSRFKEVNDKLLEALKNPTTTPTSDSAPNVDTLDLIKLGKKLQDYTDEEIDFAATYSKSTRPEDILKALGDEMVQLAISAKRDKVDKEKKALTPTGTQPDGAKPQSFLEKLASASIEEKEKLLTEAGLYKTPKARSDRSHIGKER
jgi:hypothetical protein